MRALLFNYGQRAWESEKKAATDFSQDLNIPLEVVDITSLFSEDKSSLTSSLDVPTDEVNIDDLEASRASAEKVWVSNRNGVFLNIGANIFKLDEFENLSKKSFIFPEEINKIMENCLSYRLLIPTKTIIEGTSTLTETVRKTVYGFFMQENLMETLCWFLYEEYSDSPLNIYPYSKNIGLDRSKMGQDYTFNINGEVVYLTDVFKLHRSIDDDHGASEILGHLIRLIEQILIVYFIKNIFEKKPELFENILFLSDGPLAFFDRTANMHRPMRKLCNFLQKEFNLFFVGIEKSGMFVDHAQQICNLNILKENEFMLLSNDYIHKHIKPPSKSNKEIYGSTTYYSGKVIFRSEKNSVYVLSIPIEDKNIIKKPLVSKYTNLPEILIIIRKLRCDMYDNAIVPIALANKLVSLSNRPSKNILEKYVKGKIAVNN